MKGGLVKEKDIPIKMKYEGIEKMLIIPYNKKQDILSFVLEDEGRISPELLYMVLIEIIEYFQKKETSKIFMNDNINEYLDIIENIKNNIAMKKEEMLQF